MWIANAVGWFPNIQRAELHRRLQLANGLALLVSQHVHQQRVPELNSLLKAVVARHPEFESAGWRTPTGRLLVDIGEHHRRWQGNHQDPYDLKIDIQFGDRPAGTLEFRLAPIPELGVGYAYMVYPGPLIYGTSLTSLCLTWFILRRATNRRKSPGSSLANVHSAFDALTEAVFLVDRKSRVVLHNHAFSLLVGRGDCVRLDPAQLSWRDPFGGYSEAPLPWESSLTDGNSRHGIIWGLAQEDASLKLLRVNTVPVQQRGKQTVGVMVSLEDITVLEQQRAEMVRVMADLKKSEAEIKLKNAELQFLATSDALTGCLNRRSFYQMYSKLVAAGHFARCSLIMSDIDHFKRINDQHGHGTGDLVLKSVGRIMRHMAPNKDWVFRLGGEEFCILLPLVDARNAVEIAEAVRESIAHKPIEGLTVTASFGVMTVDYAAPSPDLLLENADLALYESKHGGRNRVTHFESLPKAEIETTASATVQSTPDEVLPPAPDLTTTSLRGDGQAKVAEKIDPDLKSIMDQLADLHHEMVENEVKRLTTSDAAGS